MRNKLKATLLSSLLVLTLTGCGYDGHYRYPCQDPDNWESKECKPPVCSVSGTCPDVLVGDNNLELITPTEDTITQSEETNPGDINE